MDQSMIMIDMCKDKQIETLCIIIQNLENKVNSLVQSNKELHEKMENMQIGINKILLKINYSYEPSNILAGVIPKMSN